MKKSLFVAAVATLALVACNKKETIETTETVDSAAAKVEDAAKDASADAKDAVKDAAAKVKEGAAKVEEAVKK